MKDANSRFVMPHLVAVSTQSITGKVAVKDGFYTVKSVVIPVKDVDFIVQSTIFYKKYTDLGVVVKCVQKDNGMQYVLKNGLNVFVTNANAVQVQMMDTVIEEASDVDDSPKKAFVEAKEDKKPEPVSVATPSEDVVAEDAEETSGDDDDVPVVDDDEIEIADDEEEEGDEDGEASEQEDEDASDDEPADEEDDDDGLIEDDDGFLDDDEEDGEVSDNRETDAQEDDDIFEDDEPADEDDEDDFRV